MNRLISAFTGEKWEAKEKLDSVHCCLSLSGPAGKKAWGWPILQLDGVLGVRVGGWNDGAEEGLKLCPTLAQTTQFLAAIVRLFDHHQLTGERKQIWESKSILL